MKDRAFAEAAQALAAGEIVGIFPEGKLTETGELNPFRPGVQQMVATTPVPVVPLALSGLWGSFFSRSHQGQAMRRLRGVFSRIALTAGPPVPPDCDRAGAAGSGRARAARRAQMTAQRGRAETMAALIGLLVGALAGHARVGEVGRDRRRARRVLRRRDVPRQAARATSIASPVRWSRARRSP